MRPENWDLYTESLNKLINREMQVVLVHSDPGIGTLTHAGEVFEQAGVKYADFRISQFEPSELVSRSAGGLSYLRAKALLHNNAGYIVILDEADPLFENADRLEEVVEMLLAGCRLVVICRNPDNVIKHAGTIPVELRMPSVIG